MHLCYFLKSEAVTFPVSSMVIVANRDTIILSTHLARRLVLALFILMYEINHLDFTKTPTFVPLFPGLLCTLGSIRLGVPLLGRARQPRTVAGEYSVAFLPPGAPLCAPQVPDYPLRAGGGWAQRVGHARPSQSLSNLRLDRSILVMGRQMC